MLALHCGLRDAGLRRLQLKHMDRVKTMLTVEDSKTDAGQGRTIPLNADVLEALDSYMK